MFRSKIVLTGTFFDFCQHYAQPLMIRKEIISVEKWKSYGKIGGTLMEGMVIIDEC